MCVGGIVGSFLNTKLQLPQILSNALKVHVFYHVDDVFPSHIRLREHVESSHLSDVITRGSLKSKKKLMHLQQAENHRDVTDLGHSPYTDLMGRRGTMIGAQ